MTRSLLKAGALAFVFLLACVVAVVVHVSERPAEATTASRGLSLTIPQMKLFDEPVSNSVSRQALNGGVGRHPETSLPWSKTPERNVYLAAHRVGIPGTGGYLMFWRLPELKKGDGITLEGRGKKYRYRVTRVFVVEPGDRWVMGRIRDRDMVTLQTCTWPDISRRIIVRAERI